MATKNIVPNDNGEGGIGVTGKRWNTAFINTVTGNVTGNLTGQVLTAAQTNINSILATDLIIGEDAQTAIDFGTVNEIDFKVDNANRLTLTSSVLAPATTNQIDLGTSSLEFKDAFFDGTVTADAFAGPLTGNVTGNVSGTAATVTGAAQSNITSLGTLTSLVLSGSLTLGNDNDIFNGYGSESAPSYSFNADRDTGMYNPADNTIAFSTAGSERVRINANGILVQNGTASAPSITFSGNNGIYKDNTNSLGFTTAGGTYKFVFEYGQFLGHSGASSTPTYSFEGDFNTGFTRLGSDTLGFSTAGQNRLTISSGGDATFTGNIILTGSASNLNFSSSQDATITMSATSSGTDGRNLSIFAGASSNNASDNGGDLILRGGNAGANGSSQILFRTATTSHAYGITAEQMKIDAVGDVSVTNNLFIGSGKAIYIGGTAAANGLDDYEEGTWTPAISTSGGSITVDSSAGQYTKIGRQIIMHFQFTLSNSSNGSGILKITNLPITVDANSGAVVGAGRILDTASTISVGHYTSTNQININLYNGSYAGTDYFTTGFVTYYTA